MQIKSLLKKMFIMAQARLKLSKILMDDGIYYKAPTKTSIRRILFYFPFYEFMHYGDHLFFEPMINFLVKSGYKVEVCPIDGMKFYFEDVGYTVIDKEDVFFEEYDLIISRVEFFNLLQDVNNLVLFKIVYPSIKRPLAQDMIDKLARLLNIPSIEMTSYSKLNVKKYTSDIIEKLPPQQKFIVFNPYTDSGSYSVTARDLRKLLTFAIQYAQKQDCQIILTGSKKDLMSDKTSYPDNFVDIRALTTIPDLFTLLQNNQIITYIGFDGFLMHLANMYSKPSFVFVRRSTMIRRGQDVYKMLVPYLSTENLVTIINKIENIDETK